MTDFWSPVTPETTSSFSRQQQGSLSMRSLGHRSFGLALVALVSFLAAASPCSAEESIFKKISGVSDKAKKQFMSDFVLRRETLEDYLTSTNFTPLFSGKFEVEVFDQDQDFSETLMFVWQNRRGHMYFPPERLTKRTAAILHEIAHVHAPNAVRFLAEGFPVYLEEKLGNIEAYPTIGERIECQIAQYNKTYTQASEAVNLELFDRVPAWKTGVPPHTGSVPSGMSRGFLGDNVKLEKAFEKNDDFSEKQRTEHRRAYSYLISASFVKFVIYKHGLNRFKTLYEQTPLIPFDIKQADSGRYQRIYGKPLTELQTEWRTWFKDRPACL